MNSIFHAPEPSSPSPAQEPQFKDQYMGDWSAPYWQARAEAAEVRLAAAEKALKESQDAHEAEGQAWIAMTSAAALPSALAALGTDKEKYLAGLWKRIDAALPAPPSAPEGKEKA